MSLSVTLSALSDRNRRQILKLLKKRASAVAEINNHLSITGATLSHHLDVLKRANLISSRREGQQIIYSLNLSVMEEAAENIMELLDSNNKKKK